MYVLDQSLNKLLARIENIWSYGRCRIMFLKTNTKLASVCPTFLFEFLKLGKYTADLKLCSSERKIVFPSMKGVQRFLLSLVCEREVSLEW